MNYWIRTRVINGNSFFSQEREIHFEKRSFKVQAFGSPFLVWFQVIVLKLSFWGNTFQLVSRHWFGFLCTKKKGFFRLTSDLCTFCELRVAFWYSPTLGCKRYCFLCFCVLFYENILNYLGFVNYARPITPPPVIHASPTVHVYATYTLTHLAVVHKHTQLFNSFFMQCSGIQSVGEKKNNCYIYLGCRKVKEKSI